MLFKELFLLLFTGSPINRKSSFDLSDKTISDHINSLCSQNESFKKMFTTHQPFTGFIHGYYGREFTLRPKSSVFKENSIGDYVFALGRIEPVHDYKSIVQVSYHRTRKIRVSFYAISTFFLLLLVYCAVNLEIDDTFVYLVLALIGLYVFFLLVLFVGIYKQVTYIKKHLMNGLDRIN